MMRRFGLGVLACFGIASLFGCGDSVDAPMKDPILSNLVVSPLWMADHLSYEGQVIIDARSKHDYWLGHLENAINLAPGSLDKGGMGMDSTDLKAPADLAAVLGAVGISESSRIVIYAKEVDANAGRMFWALEYLGATDVHVLDGGYTKWATDGRATVTSTTTVQTASFTPKIDATRLATKADVLAHYQDTVNFAIVDARNAVDYQMKRIPNAVNILMGDFANPDKSLKTIPEIRAVLDSKGVTESKTVITHCYVGYRSGQEYFILRLMNAHVSNYDGSWTEWNADPSTPKEP